MLKTEPHWKRAIALIDMNAFFASVEQRDFPQLQGKPLAITNGLRGSCIITCSYEARAYGVHTGMRLKQARHLCPSLIQCPSRPKVYAKVSTNIMHALSTVSAEVEVFSIDEAFVDLTSYQTIYGGAKAAAKKLKQAVYNASGLLSSLGLSGDKTTAKYAAKLVKPNGFTVIAPWQAKAQLNAVKVTELCGIGEGIGNFLAQYGVYNCGDMEKLPISVLAKRFGNLGRRIWYMCQGADPEPMHYKVNAPKSIGHGKVMPPNTKDYAVLLTYLQQMCTKVASRMRQHQLQAKTYWIGFRTQQGWFGKKVKLSHFNDQQQLIYPLGITLLKQQWRGEGIFQLQVTALDPQPIAQQPDLFAEDEHFAKQINRQASKNIVQQKINKMLDDVNQRYGESTLMSARLLKRSDMPDVIAPAWKPTGVRRTV